jgi:anti-sigma B factor antagonist
MSFKKERIGEIDVVTLSGRFDTETAEAVGRDFDDLIAAGTGKTVVDMEAVDYISSSMIRALLKSLTQHRAADGDLYLSSLQPQIFKVLKIAGMDALFNIHDDKDKALESF